MRRTGGRVTLRGLRSEVQAVLFCKLDARVDPPSRPPSPHAGFSPAGAVLLLLVLLLLRAPPAGAPSGPDPPELPAGPGAPAAARRAEAHPQDGARVRTARRPGRAAAGGAGEESQAHQELGLCACVHACVCAGNVAGVTDCCWCGFCFFCF